MTKYQDLKNEVKISWKLKSTTIIPLIINWSNVSDEEEPYKDPTNHPWEHYHKQPAVGSCQGLINDPEKSPRNKTLRTTQLHNSGHES